MMRKKTNRRVDRAIFRHTATKTALANIPGAAVPRGGYRL